MAPGGSNDKLHIPVRHGIAGPEARAGKVDPAGADLLQMQLSDRLGEGKAKHLGNVILQNGLARVSGKLRQADADAVELVDGVLGRSAEAGQRRHEDDKIAAVGTVNLRDFLRDVSAEGGVDLFDDAVEGGQIHTLQKLRG